MQRREKILSVIFAVAVVVVLMQWQGLPFLRAMVFGSLNERAERIRTLDAAARALGDREVEMLVARRRLSDWKARSLPRDAIEAHRLYQEWLTDMAQSAGFSALRVTPELLQTMNPAYKGVRVVVKGEATFAQLTTFLHHFQRTDLLHRIVQLKVESPANGGESLKISVTAEGLCLPDAESRHWLFPRTQLSETLNRSDNAAKVVAADSFPGSGEFRVRIGSELLTVTAVAGNAWTVTRAADGTTIDRHPEKSNVELVAVRPDRKDVNLAELQKTFSVHPFAKPSPPRPDIATPTDAVVDESAGKTRLMGIVAADDDSAAWLYNESTDVLTIVRKGGSVSVGNVQGTILAVEPKFIKIKRGEEVWQLDLGKTFKSIWRVEPPATSATAPPATNVAAPNEFIDSIDTVGETGGKPGGDGSRSRRPTDRGGRTGPSSESKPSGTKTGP